jgi:hypothetical protein
MKYKNLFLTIIGFSNLAYLFVEILRQTSYNTFAILSMLFLAIANITAIILWMIPNKIIIKFEKQEWIYNSKSNNYEYIIKKSKIGFINDPIYNFYEYDETIKQYLLVEIDNIVKMPNGDVLLKCFPPFKGKVLIYKG